MSDGTEKRSSGIAPAVVIAVGSALSYCYAYAYEKGFCDVFGIPVELIKLDIARVLIVGGFLISSTWFCFIAYDLFRSVFDKTAPRLLRVLAALSALLLTAIVALSFFHGSAHWGLVYFMILVLAVGLSLGGRVELRFKDNPRSFLSRLRARIDPSWIQAALYALFVLAIVNAAGRASALGKVDFLVPVSNSDIVGLRIYGDTIICAKADLEKREIYPILSFYPVNSDFARSLEVRHLSHMKVLHDPTPR